MVTCARKTASLVLTLVAPMLASCGPPVIPPQPRPRPMAAPEQLVRAYYARLNAEDLEGLLALFAPQPEIVEPFSDPGDVTVRRGYEEVASYYAESFAASQHRVVPEFVEVRGRDVLVGWSLASQTGDGYSGLSWFRVQAGLIQRLELRRRE